MSYKMICVIIAILTSIYGWCCHTPILFMSIQIFLIILHFTLDKLVKKFREYALIFSPTPLLFNDDLLKY